MPSLEHLADRWIGRTLPKQAAAKAKGDPQDLKPVMVVTGASRGLGLALAQRFIRSGREVALVGRDLAALEEAAAAIRHTTGRQIALCTAIDVTAPDAATSLEEVLSLGGYYCDELINNAGAGAAGPFAANANEDLNRVTGTNVQALTALTRHFLPKMLERRRGGILNVASLGGAVPGPGQAAYYASKAYVLSLTEALAAECAGQGVRISALAPGPLNTGFHAAMGADQSIYRVLIPAVSLERTARSAYWGYALGRTLIVPGIMNKLVYVALRFLPHPLTVAVTRILLRRY